MAYPITLNGTTYTSANFDGTAYVTGFPDALEDMVTHQGNIYKETSTSSNSIGTGSKTFTITAGKPYQSGTPLRISSDASPTTHYMDAIVTSYSSTTLVVNVVGYAGSGTKTDWSINIAGSANLTSGTVPISQGGTGATNATDAKTNLGITASGDVVGPGSATDNAITRFDTTTGKLLQNSSATIDDSGNISAAGLTLTSALPVAQGGTGATSAAAGATALGLGTASTVSFAALSTTGEMTPVSFNETKATDLSGGTPTIDCHTGNVFKLSTSTNTTFTFSNPPASGTSFTFTLLLTAGGTHTITWPGSVDWAGGSAPDAPASGETDLLCFTTIDGGTIWHGVRASDASG